MASVLRASARSSTLSRRRPSTAVTAGIVVAAAGGSAVWMAARRSSRFSDRQERARSRARYERDVMIRRLQRRLDRGRRYFRRVDRERLKRLYEFQLQHPDPGPRETYDELIASLR
jgi:hypothetical protein